MLQTIIHSTKLQILSIFLLALVLRLFYLAAIRDAPYFHTLVIDAFEYDHLATQILRGKLAPRPSSGHVRAWPSLPVPTRPAQGNRLRPFRHSPVPSRVGRTYLRPDPPRGQLPFSPSHPLGRRSAGGRVLALRLLQRPTPGHYASHARRIGLGGPAPALCAQSDLRQRSWCRNSVGPAGHGTQQHPAAAALALGVDLPDRRWPPPNAGAPWS